ncbi:hypothetical protein KSP40_PGU011196 [Platanthera guangdongensis]|uniref:Solute carrier family 35 member F5 n=1 Tax=Platanthera guangdongensis TaxID=2320717 RepID=A0ABR2LX18_9ASPA
MGAERAYRDSWRWSLGIAYIVAVASIWIAASYIVQTVVDEGVSPFLLTYICNSLFVVYIPIVEIARYLEDSVDSPSVKHHNEPYVSESDSENVNLLASIVPNGGPNITSPHGEASPSGSETTIQDKGRDLPPQVDVFSSGNPLSSVDKQLDSKGRWLRSRVAKVSLLICPFWFFAQLTFNLSLKYTTVTSNTILSSSSSLFTFLVSVAFLGEKFTWVKLVSVFLCMGGTVIVSLADVGVGVNAIVSNPVLGDALTLISACLYAVYISLIRKNLPDEMKGEGHASMAQFLGYLGLFNLLIFLPVALGLEFTKIESFHKITWNQFSLIVGKEARGPAQPQLPVQIEEVLPREGGDDVCLLDNVVSDYLWAKAILLTTTTVAAAGLTIQVPIAAIVDSITGHAPRLLDYIGAVSIILGFVGINIPSFEKPLIEEDTEDIVDANHDQDTPALTLGT